jgi:uncharacterized protein (TIGR03086 family)
MMAGGPQGARTDLVDKYAQALDGAKRLVGSVQPAELSKPTPCEGWDVKALLTHMVGTNRRFAAALAGDASKAAPAGDDVLAEYAASAEEGLAAWRKPGALDTTLGLPSGQVPGTTGIGMIFVDQLIHTWDLAKALGRGDPLPDDLATTALELSRARVTPDRRGPGKPYAEEIQVAGDRPTQDRLAGFLGRQP